MKKNVGYRTSLYVTIVTIDVFAILMLLKLTGVIAWSWWWITAPVWIPFLLAVILVVIYFVLLRKYNNV